MGGLRDFEGLPGYHRFLYTTYTFPWYTLYGAAAAAAKALLKPGYGGHWNPKEQGGVDDKDDNKNCQIVGGLNPVDHSRSNGCPSAGRCLDRWADLSPV